MFKGTSLFSQLLNHVPQVTYGYIVNLWPILSLAVNRNTHPKRSA